ncbi:MAG: hypothetical protein AVDCRST_MAG67-4264 [uncultured Solirubrobacteraceae bacterium]|uniref:Uncharacterized protein n=1 Tax=uncultured Solirubrobacteraceae bacterium TaxID=1162706 RepID=A0A6J4TQD6_9ACTN|nr:MAG: hypothetical protein AVDCRST_MAG67-4264 [uncultured Solirubrobacteraceae bacterium]
MQLLELLLRDLHLFECPRDLVEREKAALLPIGDERSQLVELVDRRLVRQQNFVFDASAPLGCRLCLASPRLASSAAGLCDPNNDW